MYKLLERMPELAPFEADFKIRMERYEKKLSALTKGNKSLNDFANAHQYYGFHKIKEGWVYREWAPAADQLYLAGDFNSWSWTEHPLKKLENGNWEITLSDEILHKGSKVMTVVDNKGTKTQHLPVYTRRAVQDPSSASWCTEVWDDLTPYPWTDQNFKNDEEPLIYEAHVGMASEEYKVASYVEFADNILPYIKETGYNTIQLMGIMEHPYYGSFGYQVSNFYAASSRYGTPDELKYLIDKAHSLGIRVLLDLVHSHAVGNTLEGLNMFDGTVYQFFHEGGQGDHPAWGTKLFNYDKNEVLHFLLSNLKFWMEEFHFDGFRFDGVTSMLYHDHGLGVAFSTLDTYFTMNTDVEAITYLQLANKLAREVNPNALTIAEDMSGMPGMCEPIEDGGIGFDYRLGMGLPDMWIKLVKSTSDEYWNLGNIWTQLTFRNAKTVAYVESHDQALVGDQTMMFRLAGAEMYTQMSKSSHTLVIDRAMALHKMIRLLTMSAGGNGYLNFMGNEFGHPEWLDFPREGNGWSYHHCRRQWSLLKNQDLKYEQLYAFDKEMILNAKEYKIFSVGYPKLNYIHEDDHVLAYERNGLLYVFNFNPTVSFNGYKIPVSKGVDYEVLFNSDESRFGGYSQIANMKHSAKVPGLSGNNLSLYLPSRTCMVLKPVK